MTQTPRAGQRPKEQAEFIDALVKDLPSLLPMESKMKLATIAYSVKKHSERASPTASERWADAKQIQAAAKALTKELFRWHREFSPESGDLVAITQTEAKLREDGLSEEEISMARLGCDPYLFQFVVIGLQTHMYEVQHRFPATRGARKKWQANYLASALLEEFDKAGLEPSQNGTNSKKGDTAFVGACRKVFEAAGIEASPNAAARKVLENRSNSPKSQPN